MLKLLGRGMKYFRKVEAEAAAERAAMREAPAKPLAALVPELSQPKPTTITPRPGVKPFKFHNITQANAEIARLESLLGAGRPAPSPATKPGTPAVTGAKSFMAKQKSTPLPSWAECSKNFSTAKASLTDRLKIRSGCDFASEVIEATGLTNASLEAQTGALMTACWLAGDSDQSSAPAATTTAFDTYCAMQSKSPKLWGELCGYRKKNFAAIEAGRAVRLTELNAKLSKSTGSERRAIAKQIEETKSL